VTGDSYFTTILRITPLRKNITQCFHFYVKKNKVYTTGEVLQAERTVRDVGRNVFS